jgi:hypothetical protein
MDNKTKKSTFMGKEADINQMIERANEWFAERGEHLREKFAQIGPAIAKTMGIAVATVGLLIGAWTLMGCDNGGGENSGGGNSGGGNSGGGNNNQPQKTNQQLENEFREFLINCGIGTCGMGSHDIGEGANIRHIGAFLGTNMRGKNVQATGLTTATLANPGRVTSIQPDMVTVSDNHTGNSTGTSFANGREQDGIWVKDLIINQDIGR